MNFMNLINCIILRVKTTLALDFIVILYYYNYIILSYYIIFVNYSRNTF